MEEKQKKLYLNIFSGLVGFGVGLALVAMFISVVTLKVSGQTATATLFDDDISQLGVSIAFPLIAFIVTVIGGVMLAVAATMRIKLNKNNNALLIASIAITAVGAILVLVAGILLKNDVEDASIAMIVEEALKVPGTSIAQKEIIEAMARSMVSINIGAGIWLGFIGGLISAIGGALFFLKPFAPSKPAAPATEPVAPTEQNGGNNQNTTL